MNSFLIQLRVIKKTLVFAFAKLVFKKRNTMSDRSLVRKDKHLILAKNNWTETEGKLFATLIKELNPKDMNDFRTMTITIDELEKLWSKKDVNTSRIRETCHDLQTKAYEIPLFNEKGKVRGYKYFSLFHNIVYEFDLKYIKFQFHDDMKPFLIDFASQFVNYDISNILQFKSKYTLSFYEFFKLQTQFKKEKLITEVLELQELREWLSLNKNKQNKFKNDKYTRFYDLKKYVLDQVKQDMLTSDIEMDYSVIKQGRYPTHVKFTFTKNNKLKETNSLFEDHELKSEFDIYIGKKFKDNKNKTFSIVTISKITGSDILSVITKGDNGQSEIKVTLNKLNDILNKNTKAVKNKRLPTDNELNFAIDVCGLEPYEAELKFDMFLEWEFKKGNARDFRKYLVDGLKNGY